MRLLEIDGESVRRRIVSFIAEQSSGKGFSRLVVGLSGGLDSSVCAFLAVDALGRSNVIGVLLPHRQSSPSSLQEAQKIIELLGIASRQIQITPMVTAIAQAFPEITELQLGNVMARARMISLYQISAEENALVLGTSNKTELLLGYGTLCGDLAGAFDPLGDLYKTQVRALARHLGVPAEIIQKIPSADLWPGQSDEGELGFTYEEADRFLARWIDQGYTPEQMLQEGFSLDFIQRITRRVQSQQFKRSAPSIPRITSRTSGAEIICSGDWLT